MQYFLDKKTGQICVKSTSSRYESYLYLDGIARCKKDDEVQEVNLTITPAEPKKTNWTIQSFPYNKIGRITQWPFGERFVGSAIAKHRIGLPGTEDSYDIIIFSKRMDKRLYFLENEDIHVELLEGTT